MFSDLTSTFIGCQMVQAHALISSMRSGSVGIQTNRVTTDCVLCCSLYLCLSVVEFFSIVDATIYVGGLDDKVTEGILWELFLQAGPVGMLGLDAVSCITLIWCCVAAS